MFLISISIAAQPLFSFHRWVRRCEESVGGHPENDLELKHKRRRGEREEQRRVEKLGKEEVRKKSRMEDKRGVKEGRVKISEQMKGRRMNVKE